MKVLTIFLVFICFNTSAQINNYSLKPIPVFDGVMYTDVYFFKGYKVGWICGGMGTLLRTNDYGKTWKEINLFNDVNDVVAFKKIIFNSNENEGWIIGKIGTIFHTLDAGNTWKKINIRTHDNIVDICYTNDGILRVFTDKLNIYETKNSGNNWTKIYCDYSVAHICQFSNSFCIYGEGGGAYRYDAAKNEYVDISLDIDDETEYNSVKDIKFSSLLNKYIGICSNGWLINTDQALNFKVFGQIKGIQDVYDLDFDKSIKSLYVLGDFSKLYKSTDTGRSWKLIFDLSNNAFDLYKLNISEDGSNIWICGGNRTIIHSNDFGNTWQYMSGNFRNRYLPLLKNNFTLNGSISEAVLDKEKNQIYAAGNFGIISLIDIDKYESNRLTPDSVKDDFLGIYFDNTNKEIYAVGDNLTISKINLKTKHYHILHKEPKSEIALTSISFNSNQSIGVAVGREGNVYISKNHGVNWQKVIFFDSLFLSFSDVAIQNDEINIIGEKGILFKSKNGGTKWESIHVADSSNYLISIAFFEDRKTAIITAADGRCSKKLYKTDDYGSTWYEVTNFPNDDFEDLQHVAVANDNHTIYVTGSYGNIYKSFDKGLNWFKTVPKLTYNVLRYIIFDKYDNPIFLGKSGTLLFCKQKDYLPLISDFKITHSITDNDYHAKILVSDKESSNSIKYVLTIVENLNESSDKKYKVQYFDNKNLKNIESYPSEIFNTGRKYTFRLTVFDGWNIIRRDYKILIGETKWQQFKKTMYWDRFPTLETLPKTVAINFGLLSVLYALFIILLYLISPIRFVFIHEVIASSRLPFPKHISKYLVLFLIESDRSLDSFVSHYRNAVLGKFDMNEEVKSRSNWFKSPFTINNKDIITFSPLENVKNYIPGLSELKDNIDTERTIICIEGQGGIGKTSLAIQIAKWAIDIDSSKRLFSFMSLPIYIDKLDNHTIEEVIFRKIELYVNRPLSDALKMALLRKKRLLAIVDGLSEMQELKANQYEPDQGGSNCFSIVFTSRKPVSITYASVIYPIGLRIGFLDMLIDGFTNLYAGAYKFGQQREILRGRIKSMIYELTGSNSEIQVPLSILKETILQASDIIDRDLDLEKYLPKTIDELFEKYLADLFRKTNNIDDAVLALRKVALVSVGLKNLLTSHFTLTNIVEVRPMWIPENIIKNIIPLSMLELFTTSGVIIKTGTIGDRLLKFSHDPLGEYLACTELFMLYREEILTIEQLKHIYNTSSSVSFKLLFLSVLRKRNVDLNN